MTAALAWLALLPAGGDDSPRPVDRPEGPPPGEVADSFVPAPGLAVDLVAAEPLVTDPVALRFDETGRAWVVEMRDYPTPPPGGFTAENPPRGRVRVLEDTDGDGRFDAATTFADRLAFPTGVQPWRGGAFVTLAGRVSFFPDADRDGAADREEVWFTGFAEGNEQLRANRPTLGADGLIYIANGLRGGTVGRGPGHPSFSALSPKRKRGVRSADGGLTSGPSLALRAHTTNDDDVFPLDISGRDFAFDPHAGSARAAAGAGQFGMSLDDYGDRFFCENRRPVRHAVLPDALAALNPHYAAPSVVHDVAAWGADSQLFPVRAGFTTSLAHAGQFTAACGLLRYLGGNLAGGEPGDAFAGDFFVCEPTVGVVRREIPTPAGATFNSRPARAGAEFLASSSPWFRPVNLTAGPDGAIYVCDFARAVVEHPHWMPPELKDRPDLRDGATLGRLWRVRRASVSQNEPAAAVFADATVARLAELLSDPNGWRRATASRLLYERRDPAAVPAVRAALRTGSHPGGRARAAYYLSAAGELTDADALAGLNDPHPRVAGVVARLAADGAASEAVRTAIAGKLKNAGGRPAFDLCVALAPHAVGPGAWPGAFGALVAAARRGDDPYLHAAVLAGAGRGGHPVGLTAALWRAAASDANPIDPARDAALLEASAAIAGRRGEIAATAGMAVGSALADRELSPAAAAVLRGLHATAAGPLKTELHRLPAADRATLAGAVGAFLETSRDRPGDAILLGLLAETRPQLFALAADDPDPAVRVAAVRALARPAAPADEPPAPFVELIAGLPAETPAVREALLDLALAAPDRTATLLDLIDAGELSPAAVGPARARRLTDHADPAVRARAAELFAPAGDRAAALAAYRSCLELEGDVERGRIEFARVCATCHAVDGAGVAVGSDISDTYNRTPESLLTDILDPNRAVDGGGLAYAALTTDGRVLTGVLKSETAGSVTLAAPGGAVHAVPRGELLELRAEGISLMPAGLETQLTPAQMADLIAFLKGWRYAE